MYRCQGTDSVRIGKDKKIESNWDKAKSSDFIISGALASVSIPMYYLGLVAFAQQISLQNRGVGIAYFIVLTLGAMGGVGFHLNACFMPLIYKTVIEKGGTILAKCSKVFHTFPLALTNTLGLGSVAVIALVSML